MRLHRFIVDFDSSDKLKITDPEILNQIRNVLRLKIGEEIILGDGRQNEAKAKISIFDKNSVEVNVLERYQNKNEPERDVVLYCSILKRENFELVVQKATEIGVKEIVPVISERTVKLNIRPDRLEKIIKEAAEQSGRGVVPKLRESVEFKEAVPGNKDALNILFDQSGESFEPGERLNRQINTWIGPEGGWSANEINLARSSGFLIFNLGKLTLRAETAAIIAVYESIHKK